MLARTGKGSARTVIVTNLASEDNVSGGVRPVEAGVTLVRERYASRFAITHVQPRLPTSRGTEFWNGRARIPQVLSPPDVTALQRTAGKSATALLLRSRAVVYRCDGKPGYACGGHETESVVVQRAKIDFGT
jgi:hypothetical protein